GLDAATRDVVDGLVRRAAASGATVIVASHELERATALAGRSVTIVGGVIPATGDPTAPSADASPPQTEASPEVARVP
ncbi:MAG: hypothetical protein ACXV5S_05675, partial [Acidimicrobiales bacterium]